MRINEILTESQLEQLDEGPIGSALGAVGRGIGKAVGGVAKGVGAVAGGVVGAGRALKKGYQAGKAVVGDDPDPNAGQPGYTDPAAAPAAGGGAPAAAPSGAAPSTQDINAQGPAGTAPAKPQTGAAGAALAKTTAAVDKQTSTKAGETVYAQVKANVDKLDKKGKQRILQLLTKSMAAPDPKAAPAGAPKPGAAPAAPKGNYDGNTGEPISDKGKADAASMAAFKASPKGQAQQAKWDAEDAAAAGQAPAADPAAAAPANTMANAPVSATNTADPSNPNLAQPAADAADPAAGQGAFANVAQQLAKPTGRAQGGGKVAGELSQNPRAVKRRADRAAAAAAKQPAAVTASLVHHGKSLNEVLAQKLEMHKRRMFESALSQGTASVFVK